jgi:hypothetical protein
MKDEALKLALEALESVLANHNGAPVLPWIEARDAIKQALAAPVQEPLFTYDQVKAHIQAAMMSAAQRPWAGLTDEEIDEWTPEIHAVIRAVEAKLREKNNG